MLHRDIKPDNVLLTAAGRCKIADFGCARYLWEQAPTSEEQQRRALEQAGVDQENKMTWPVGTFFYMAPEVSRGGSYGTEADVYSWGVTAFQIATSSLPKHLDAVSSSFEGQALFERARSNDPAVRGSVLLLREDVYFENVDWALLHSQCDAGECAPDGCDGSLHLGGSARSE